MPCGVTKFVWPALSRHGLCGSTPLEERIQSTSGGAHVVHYDGPILLRDGEYCL